MMNTCLKLLLPCAAALTLSACGILGGPPVPHEAIYQGKSASGRDVYHGSKEPPPRPRVVEGAGNVYECRNHRCEQIR